MAAASVSGRTIHISPDGTGDVPTIQAGMGSAGVGDTLLLASGTFVGAGNHSLIVPGKSLVFRSETGNPADCVVDCQGQFALGFRAGRAVVEGIGIRGSGTSAVRIYNESSFPTPNVKLRSCLFAGNSASDGGAIYIDCVLGLVTITECEFSLNAAAWRGGGIYMYGSGGSLEAYVRSCTFHSNTAGEGGAVYISGDEVWVDITGSAFYLNSAWSGGAIKTHYSSRVHVSGSTFVSNSAAVASALDAGDLTTCAGCIMAQGTGGSAYNWLPGEMGDTPAISCTDIYGNEGGDWVGDIAGLLGQQGNFSACPGFCNADTEPYDLRLCDTSPCLPGNNPNGYNCGLVGAFGQGCACGPSATEPSTWGAIKAMYR